MARSLCFKKVNIRVASALGLLQLALPDPLWVGPVGAAAVSSAPGCVGGMGKQRQKNKAGTAKRQFSKKSKTGKSGLARGAKKTVAKPQRQVKARALQAAVENLTPITVVRFEDTKRKLSIFVDVAVDIQLLQERQLGTETVEELPKDTSHGLRNAAHHPEHGVVTYMQEVQKGGVFVYVNDPKKLQERFFGPGSWVAFQDAKGPGHAQRVGPDGATVRTILIKGTKLIGLHAKLPQLVTATGTRI